MPSAFHSQSDVVDSCKISTGFYVRWFRGVDHTSGKLLHAAVILNAWETSIVLPIWLHGIDGILSMKVGDSREARYAQDALLNTGRNGSHAAAGGSGARSWPEMEVLRVCHCAAEGQDAD